MSRHVPNPLSRRSRHEEASLALLLAIKTHVPQHYIAHITDEIAAVSDTMRHATRAVWLAHAQKQA